MRPRSSIPPAGAGAALGASSPSSPPPPPPAVREADAEGGGRWGCGRGVAAAAVAVAALGDGARCARSRSNRSIPVWFFRFLNRRPSPRAPRPVPSLGACPPSPLRGRVAATRLSVGNASPPRPRPHCAARRVGSAVCVCGKAPPRPDAASADTSRSSGGYTSTGGRLSPDRQPGLGPCEAGRSPLLASFAVPGLPGPRGGGRGRPPSHASHAACKDRLGLGPTAPEESRSRPPGRAATFWCNLEGHGRWSRVGPPASRAPRPARRNLELGLRVV